MKRWLIIMMMVLLVGSSLLPIVTTSGDGIIVTKLSDGSSTKDITIPPTGGIDASNSLELPKTAVVTESRFNVTGKPGTSNTWPSGVSIDVGNDGDYEWNFSGTGYGPLGNQSVFADGSSELYMFFGGPGISDTDSIYLPKNATVTSATARVIGGGGGTSRIDVWDDDFSTDKGWTGYGGPAEWERGSAVAGGGDPGSDHTPTSDNYLIGNDIGSTYENSIPISYLTSPPIDCTQYQNCELEFWRVLRIESYYFDHARVDAYNGASWVMVWDHSGSTVTETAWSEKIYDVSAYADGISNFQIRFGFGPTDSSVTYGGWSIDDLAITADGPGTDNASIDFGDDGTSEWNHTGEYLGIEYMQDFSSSLNGLIATTPIAFTDGYGNDMVEIPINVTVESGGLLRVNQLAIEYLYTTTVDVNPHIGNLTNELNMLLPHTGEGNMTIPIKVSCVSGGIVNISSIFIDYYIPPVTNDALYLLNGHGTDGKICYSQYEDYTLRANVSSRNGYNDISNVTATLGLGTWNIQVKWNRTTDTFTEISDPNDYVELVTTSCTSTTDSLTKWTLDFVVDFHWSYPNEFLTDCQLNTSSNSFFPIENPFFEIYRVENDLDLIGTTVAVAAVQGALNSGDWVKGNETINWTGLTAVYQGTTNIYPADTYFNITMTNDTGYSWVDTISSGSQFDIESQVDPMTDPSDIHHIDITDIPGSGTDSSSVTFEVKVDATAPAPPDNIVCHADGPGIGSSVWDNDGLVYVSWSGGPWQDTQSGKFDDAMAYDDPFPTAFSSPGDSAIGAEGLSTFYVRTLDNVGNWGVADSASITVDLTPLVYTNPFPSPAIWHTNDNVDVGVTISDPGGSGVAGDMIQYRYTGDGALDSEIWTDYPDTASGESIDTSILIDFGYDGYKLVQWRAKDVADGSSTQGAPYIESMPYSLRIDTTPPTIEFVSPNGWQSSKDVELRVNVNDMGSSGIDLTQVEYYTSTDGGISWSSGIPIQPTPQNGDLNSTVLQYTEEFQEGSNNWIKWKAKDLAGNGFESQPTQIFVDTVAPAFYDVMPSQTQWQTTTEIDIGITFIENTSSLDTTSLEYRTTTSGADGFTPWTSLPPFLGASQYTANMKLGFSEGTDNAIQWRIRDIAGNTLETNPFRIIIDTTGVSFGDATPEQEQWQRDTNVECTIEMEDLGSGVDGGSIQLSISTSGENGFGDWQDLPTPPEDGEMVSAVVLLEFAEGTSNYIQWRVRDIAGNDHSISQAYQIKVDTKPVSFSEPIPDPVSVLISRSQVVGIRILDGGSGILPTSISYSFSYGGDGNWGEWISAEVTSVADASMVQVTKAVEVPVSRDTYIRWMAHDVAGNERVSDPYRIRVDAAPVAIITSPSEGDQFNTSTTVVFDGGTSYDPDTEDTISFTWSIDGKAESGSTLEKILGLGLHSITLTVTDTHGLTSNARVNITVVAIEAPPSDDDTDDGPPIDDTVDGGDEEDQGKEGDDGGDMTIWWILIAVIVIAVCLLLFLVLRRKKTPKEGEAALPVQDFGVPPVPATHFDQAQMYYHGGPGVVESDYHDTTERTFQFSDGIYEVAGRGGAPLPPPGEATLQLPKPTMEATGQIRPIEDGYPEQGHQPPRGPSSGMYEPLTPEMVPPSQPAGQPMEPTTSPRYGTVPNSGPSPPYHAGAQYQGAPSGPMTTEVHGSRYRYGAPAPGSPGSQPIGAPPVGTTPGRHTGQQVHPGGAQDAAVEPEEKMKDIFGDFDQ